MKCHCQLLIIVYAFLNDSGGKVVKRRLNVKETLTVFPISLVKIYLLSGNIHTLVSYFHFAWTVFFYPPF